MEFEFDEKKSQTNAEKHGIDSRTAQLLWIDPHRLIVQARSDTEPRYAMIALLGDHLWTTVYTLREERVRIISVRRSRHGEKKGYHNS